MENADRRIESKKGLPAHCEDVRIDWERAWSLAFCSPQFSVSCPRCAAAQTDTGPGRDIAAIHHLIEQYAKAVDTVDLNLLSQIWSHSPEVSFIYPLGEEHGFDAIEQQVFQNIMGGMFSARDLEMHGVAIHVSGNAGWSEFHWIFHATMRKDGSAVTTHGVETQVYRKRIWEVAAGPRPLLRRPPVRPLSTCLRDNMPLGGLAPMRWFAIGSVKAPAIHRSFITDEGYSSLL